MAMAQVEVLAVERRRRWSRSEKERLVAASFEPGVSGSEVARSAGIHVSQLFRWRKQLDTSKNLAVPKNITMILLPSRTPELNPVENIWQYLRQNWLSNRVFETYDDIVDAWRKLIAQPATITSIGSREWTLTGQW